MLIPFLIWGGINMIKTPIHISRIPIRVIRMTECPCEKPYGYIYMYTNRQNGHKYIGKHKFNKPYIDLNYRGSGTKHWQSALSKYDWVTDFVKEVLFWLEFNPQLTPQQHNSILNEKEIFFINILGTYENPQDYNETPGGDGVTSEMVSGKKNPMYGDHRFAGKNNYFYGKHFCGSQNPNWGGKCITEYQRQFMRNFMTGKEPPNKGVKMSPERLKQHTAAMRVLVQTPEWRKRQQQGVDRRTKNPEWLKHIREYAKTRQKPVVQFTLAGIKIQEFESALQAATDLGHKDKNAIQHACTGISNSAYGYRWMYKEDYLKMLQEESTS